MPRITDVRTGLYRLPNETALEDATQSFDGLELITVRLEDETGAHGTGFTYTIGSGGRTIRTFLGDVCTPIVLEGSAAPRALRGRLAANTTFVGREGISELALSAIDVAAWDLLGNRLGAPLYELLGGERREVPVYETDGGWLHFDVETLVRNAEEAVEEGFSGFKMKVGRGHGEDEERVRAVNEVLPDGVDLLIDANCSYRVDGARRLARRLADVDLGWFEEPLEKGDYAAYADLRRHVDVPIATGENLYNVTQFKGVVERGGADVLQPDVARVGGVTPWLAVAEVAEAWGLSLSPHYVEPVHVHLAVSSGNVPYVEHHSTVLDEVVRNPLTVRDGTFEPPAEPGHGIEFDGLDAYAIQR
ncbi:mandelate racemase/muconate lactonizing enzyme family protein [Natronorarus salvus]|uniref:mandelate racemase/muconate lactonizing enzyme family protein n=1 Tax=Natronorarus salvus TaxID=3117733 RepID=UPI002F268FF7